MPENVDHALKFDVRSQLYSDGDVVDLTANPFDDCVLDAREADDEQDRRGLLGERLCDLMFVEAYRRLAAMAIEAGLMGESSLHAMEDDALELVARGCADSDPNANYELSLALEFARIRLARMRTQRRRQGG